MAKGGTTPPLLKALRNREANFGPCILSLDISNRPCYLILMDIISTPDKQLGTPTGEEAAAALSRAQLKAAVGFEIMVELLTMRGFETSISTKGALDISEHLYKVSGMAQKQAPPPVMPTVRFNFNSNRATGVDIEMEFGPEVSSAQNFSTANHESPANTSTRPSYLDKYPIIGNPLDVEFTEE